MESLDTFSTKKSIIIDKKKYYYFNLEKFFNEIGLDSKKIPFSVKILIENILRNANLNQINLSKFKYLSKLINLINLNLYIIYKYIYICLINWINN